MEASRLIERTASKVARRAGSPEMANDAAGDAWVELLKDAHRWDPARGDWSSFVLTVVARCVRRSIYTMKAPMSGSPWRAHRWSLGMHATGEEALAGHAAPTLSPEAYVIGDEFLGALREALADQPDAELAMAVFVDGDRIKDIVEDFQVPRGRVLAAVARCREVVGSVLGHFVPEWVQVEGDER